MKRFKVRMSNGEVTIVNAVSLVDAARQAESLYKTFGIYAYAMEIEY